MASFRHNSNLSEHITMQSGPGAAPLLARPVRREVLLVPVSGLSSTVLGAGVRLRPLLLLLFLQFHRLVSGL